MIRLEERGDFREVENLAREAFWNIYRPGCDEHFILHNLRDDPCFVPELSYVIEAGRRIVGQIAYAKGRLKLDSGGETDILLFGPISVLPEYQRKGYGGKLIRFTLERAKELGYPAVVISGSPAYYGRFGFESGSKHGIFHEGADRSEEAPFFMVKILDDRAAKALKGTYSDPPVYTTDSAALEEFDRSFPPKKKEKRPGQLWQPEDDG